MVFISRGRRSIAGSGTRKWALGMGGNENTLKSRNLVTVHARAMATMQKRPSVDREEPAHRSKKKRKCSGARKESDSKYVCHKYSGGFYTCWYSIYCTISMIRHLTPPYSKYHLPTHMTQVLPEEEKG